MVRVSTLFVIGTELAAALTPDIGEVGVDVFLGYLPDSPDPVVSLWENPGPGPMRTHGSGVVIDVTEMQVITRGAPTGQGAQHAENRAWLIADYLDAVTDRTFTGVYFHSIERLGVPALVERDAQGRPMFSTNYIVRRTP